MDAFATRRVVTTSAGTRARSLACTTYVALLFTRLSAGWMKRKNLASLQALGALSGEVQESMSNFRVIVAFNRVDYFKEQFEVANARNYASMPLRVSSRSALSFHTSICAILPLRTTKRST